MFLTAQNKNSHTHTFVKRDKQALQKALKARQAGQTVKEMS